MSRLIGAPPGYVGFDQGGLLTEAITKKPHCGAAARRDREGAPGHLQHPAAGDGPRHADRQQRAQGRLPQRDHRHDDQRGRRGAEQGVRSASPTAGPAGRRDGRHQAHVHAGVPQPARRDRAASRRSTSEIILRVVDKFLLQLEEQLHEKKVERRPSPTALRKYLAQEGLRSADGRAADGAPDPGHDPQARWPTSCCSASWSTAAASTSTSRTASRRSRPRPNRRSCCRSPSDRQRATLQRPAPVALVGLGVDLVDAAHRAWLHARDDARFLRAKPIARASRWKSRPCRAPSAASQLPLKCTPVIGIAVLDEHVLGAEAGRPGGRHPGPRNRRAGRWVTAGPAALLLRRRQAARRR